MRNTFEVQTNDFWSFLLFSEILEIDLFRFPNFQRPFSVCFQNAKNLFLGEIAPVKQQNVLGIRLLMGNTVSTLQQYLIRDFRGAVFFRIANILSKAVTEPNFLSETPLQPYSSQRGAHEIPALEANLLKYFSKKYAAMFQSGRLRGAVRSP